MQTDSAMFDCMAVNSLGSESSSGELRVLAFAPNFQKNPMVPVLGMVGRTAVMTCQPEAAPTPNITWLFQGTPLAPVPSVMDPATGELSVSVHFFAFMTWDIQTYTPILGVAFRLF